MLRSKHLLPLSILSLTASLSLLNGASVALADESPSPTPSEMPSVLPSASPSPSPVASAEPSPEVAASPSPFPSASPSLSPSPVASPDPSPSPSPSESPPVSPWVRSAAGIQFSSEIPFTQYQELSQDLDELSTVPITKPDSKFLSVMGLKDASPQSLLGWLTERVHFIVDENYSIEPQVLENNHAFPNPEISPVTFGGKDSLNDEAAGDILMANLGSSYYSIAKQHNLLVSVYVQGVGDVTLNSPRAGILKIGPALFDGEALGAGTDTQLHNARRTLQLAVLFHEARHSDGHGVHLGFNHVTCPAGHAMAGLPACDANLNGPYSIQAHYLRSVERSCEQCSTREHEILRLAALDNISRVQKEIVDPAKDPVAVLKQTQMLSSYCDGISDMDLQNEIPEDLAKDCAKLPKLKIIAQQIKKGKYKVPTVQSTHWDPMPEGSFDPTVDVH